MIHRLLDDITAQAPDESSGAPPGLDRLTLIRLPRGTVLDRKQLEDARRGEWLPDVSSGDA
jgi:hypothetical protein